MGGDFDDLRLTLRIGREKKVFNLPHWRSIIRHFPPPPEQIKIGEMMSVHSLVWAWADQSFPRWPFVPLFSPHSFFGAVVIGSFSWEEVLLVQRPSPFPLSAFAEYGKPLSGEKTTIVVVLR